MRTSNRFQSLFEQFPTFRLKKEKVATPRRSAGGEHNLTAEAELPLDELDRAHYLLASSIDVLANTTDDTEPELRDNIQKVVIEDAEDLAARVLSPAIVDLLEITPKSPEHIGTSHVEDATTELRTLYLLIHAYDATKDAHIRRASEYILKETTPQSVELLQEAYKRGAASGDSIINEYRRLNAGIDSALEDVPKDNTHDDLDTKLRLLEVEPGAPDTTRALAVAAMKAPNGENIDPFVKSYLKNMAVERKAARTKRAGRSLK